MSVEEAIEAILAEHARATTLHPPFHSAHEGYAIIKEEFDEAWMEIMANAPVHARKEMVQTGAMIVRFLTECGP